MSIPYAEVIAGPELRTRFEDTALVSAYRDAGSPAGELIYLGFGETWTQVPPGLTAHLSGAPPHAHGYVISQYGLPRLQRTLRDYIASTHRLDDEPGRDYEVAVCCGGTRNAFFDFGRFLQAHSGVRTPVAITPMPGWDYAGVLEPLGYRMRHLHATGDPSPAQLTALIEEIAPDETLALVIVNAQHNPTGTNWRTETVRQLIRRALAADAALLLDDAYFGVHDPDLTPTSALRVLLEELAHAPTATRRRWLAARSLGKQFHCSGWGIGAMVADPRTLDTLVNELQFQHAFASAIPLQEAMANWLEDPAAERFLADTGREYTRKRAAVGELLAAGLGYPPHRVHLGECGPYVRIELPPAAGSVAEFRRDCLRDAGVLVGVDRFDAGTSNGEPPCYRLFLGPPLATLIEGLTRLRETGHGYRGS